MSDSLRNEYMNPRNMFLKNIHSFRGIAIIIIVAGHTIDWLNWGQNKEAQNILYDVFANGTALFVFISGYLFQHLSKNFNYSDYLIKKFYNVISPYLIISVPAIVYAVFRGDPTRMYNQLKGTSKIYQIIWFYITGGAHLNYPLWFIPMIAVYFLLAPLFYLFIKHPKLYLLIIVFFPLSLIVHRPEFPNPNLFHSSIYYVSAYIMGMCTSQYREKVERIIESKLTYLVTFWFVFLILQFALSNHHGNYHQKYFFDFSNGYIDWQFLQKIFLCFPLMGILSRVDSFAASKMKYIADISLTIFFIHIYFLFFFTKVLERYHKLEGNFLNWFILFVVVILCSIFFSWVGQIALGQYSRFIIGAPSRQSSGWVHSIKFIKSLNLKQYI